MKPGPTQPDPSGRYRDLTDVPQLSDQPPVAPARVAAMKAKYKQSWLYFLLIISLVVAWGVPVRYLIMRYLVFRQVNTGPRVAEAFVALSYEGISENPREVSPQRFREHFAALRKAGYNPITLDDIHAFYTEGKLLPRRAVLLTFDHARKSSYYDVRSVLTRAGWPAVMFLWTYAIESEDPASLRWPYVRAMLRSGAWEVGAQSHRGFERIVADSDGTLRNFMAAPRWLADELRYVTPDAFSQRLQQDHEYARNLIIRETGVKPRAFAFPYGDFGQYDDRAILSRRLNMDMVSRYYDLGFVHGPYALNTRFSDPRRLNRLLVRPEWTGAELIDRLENAWPREAGITDAESLVSPLAWLPEWGGFDMGDRVLRLYAQTNITGAKVWLNGSGLFGDFKARIRLRIERGQVGLHLRASPDGESYLYLGLGEGGDVWLRQKHAGLQPFTLASARYATGPDGVADLDIQLRGRHFFAAIGGRPVFQEIITTRGEPRPGMVGMSVWDPTPGRASAEVRSFEAAPFRTSVLTWTPVSSREPPLAAWMNRNAVRYTHLAPPWLRVASRAQAEQLGWDPVLFRFFARVYSMKWTPEIILDNLDTFDPALPEQLADLTAGLGADGVFFNLNEMRGSPSLSRVTTMIQAMSRALEQRKLTLIIRLPAYLERETTFAALLQGLPNLEIAVEREAHGFFPNNPRDAERIVHVGLADVRGIETPFYHVLTGLDATNQVWDSEVRGKLLRQEGHDAYRAGRFDQALEIWKRWSELEPYNEEPWRLLGDIHLRKNDFLPAIEAYRASLDRNPGQIALVVQVARLLDQRTNNRIAAAELLDLYARLFPGNSTILLAQAELLIRQNRAEPAGAIVRRVIAENPDDIEALSMLHGLLPTSAERLVNIRKILEVGSRPGMEPHFAQVIRHYDLLAWPESWVLMDFIEDMAARERALGGRGPYSALAPRETVVRELFSLNRLSDNWLAEAEQENPDGGIYMLAAAPATSEAVLRLANSDSMHSGFIEATIDESRGFFWLYARRGADSMVRFGFEQAGRMYLQIWQHGRMLSNQTRPWTRPDGPVRLRLEIRGDATFGFIDDTPAFGAPTRVPYGIGLGWWGVSPWSPHFGMAQVALREIAGGPIPITIGLLWPRMNEWDDQEVIALLKDHAPSMHAIAPPWFVQEITGRVRPEFRSDHSNLRMMARYYQMRLMPAVHSASPRTLNVADLIPLAKDARVDGFTLVFARMPDEEWFRQAELALADSEVSLLCVRLNRQENVMEVREVCPHVGLFPGRRVIRTIPLLNMNEPMPEEMGPPKPPAGAEYPRIESLPAPHRALLFL